MEPVSTAAAAVSIANGLRSLFGGGGGRVASVHQGWRVQGELSRDGLAGSNTAWDQLGNTWGGSVEAGHIYGDVFREHLGDSDIRIPVDLTVSASEGYYPGLVRQLREAFAALGATASAAPEPTLPTQSETPLVPASRFDPVPPPAAPLPITSNTPARTADDFAWSRFWSDLFPSVPAANAPMPTIGIPMNQQRTPSNPAAAPRAAAPAAPAALSMPANVTTLALLAVGAYVLVTYLNRDDG